MGAEGVVGVQQRWQLSGRLRAARVAEPTREYQVDALWALGCLELEVRAAVHRDVQGRIPGAGQVLSVSHAGHLVRAHTYRRRHGRYARPRMNPCGLAELGEQSEQQQMVAALDGVGGVFLM